MEGGSHAGSGKIVSFGGAFFFSGAGVKAVEGVEEDYEDDEIEDASFRAGCAAS